VTLETLGLLAAALLLAAAGLAPAARVRALAHGAALALTPVVLLADVWDTPEIRDLRDRPGVVAALVVLAVAAVAAGAALVARHPWALPVAAVAALPFRVPLAIGGETVNLLVPLYLVIAAAGTARVAVALRRPAADPWRPPGLLEWLLLGYVNVYALQAVYAADASQAVQHAAFFYVPFGLLFIQLRTVRWTPRLLATCLGVLAVLAVVLCAAALAQELTRHVYLNDKLRESNAYNAYFRANSLFFDPNIFGRYLVMVILLVVPVAGWARSGRRTALALAVVAIAWLGLLTTLSQSSLVALLGGLALFAVACGLERRVAVPAAALLAAAVVVLIVAVPGAVRLNPEHAGSVRKATSGRSDLVSGGASLFAKRPVVGWGSGTFELEYLRHALQRRRTRQVTASHTIPLTVAAEQGVVGLAAYIALLVAAFRLLLGGARADLARLAIAAAFAALVLHSFSYAAFLEDPATWVILAVGAALAACATQRSSSATSVSPTSRNSL
jgi:putative inorganic carbon (HCO3(-)) transporter